MISLFFCSSRRRHTRWPRDWSSDVCSSDLGSSMSVEPTRRTLVAINAPTIMFGCGPRADEPMYQEMLNKVGVKAAREAKIGRASCREGEKTAEGGGSGEKGKDLVEVWRAAA